MKTSIMFTVAFGLLAASAADLDIQTDGQVIDTPLQISDEYEIFVASNLTFTYSGVISGTGSILKRGQGTLVLSNGSNSFEGGIRIVHGTVRADAEGCLGSGDIVLDDDEVYVVGTGKNAQHFCPVRQLCLNAANATFANNVSILGYEPEGVLNVSSYAYIVALNSATLSGSVALSVLSDSGNMRHIISAGLDGGPYPTLTFTGSVSFPSDYLRVHPWGTLEFRGVVTAGTVSIGTNSRLAGTIKFANSGNSINSVIDNGAAVVCGAKDALGGAAFNVNATYASTTKSSLDLFGNDLCCQVVCYYKDTYTVQGTYVKSTSHPATLTITGTAVNRTTKNIFTDEITLVLDAAEHPSFVNTFTDRANTMTGFLCVSNGTMSMVNGSKFANVPELHIGTNGTLTVAGSTAAFASATNLVVDGALSLDSTALAPFQSEDLVVSIGENGTIAIPGTTTISAKRLYVGGSRMPDKTYYASDNIGITGDGSIVVSGGELVVVEDTWTGGAGANDSVGEGGNWLGGTAPVLNDGTLLATFAQGGNSASVSGDVSFYGLRLSASGGFSFNASGASPSMAIGTGGIAITDADGAEARTYSFWVPLSLTRNQTWTIPANATMTVAGLQTDNGVNVETAGSGTLVLSGTNTFSDAFKRLGAFTTISGLLATPGHIDQGEVELNAENRPFCVSIDCNGGGGLTFDGAMVEKPFWMRGKSHSNSARNVWWDIAAGSTNEFRGHVRASSPVGDISMGNNSVLKISHGCAFDGGAFLYGDGTWIVDGGTMNAASGSGLYVNERVKMVLNTTGNSIKLTILGGELDCCVDYALTNRTIYCSSGAPAIRLHDTVQHVRDLYVSRTQSTMTGEYPATLKVGDRTDYGLMAGSIQGWVGIDKCGTGELVLTNQVFASAGDLSVSKGTLTLGADASWKNGTNITVSANGVLALDGDRQFSGRFSVLRISGSGVVRLSPGGRHRVASAWIGDTELPPGIYGGSDAPESANKEYAEHFIGSGTLVVGVRGMAILIR